MKLKPMCDGCFWASVDKLLPFCRAQQKEDSCGFYHTKTYKSNSVECVRCKRKKDPGKCWWCGLE